MSFRSLPAVFMLHQNTKPAVLLRVRRLRSSQRSIKTAGRDLKDIAERRHREVGLLRVDPGEDYAWFLAKKAAAFFRMSRSIRSSRFSLRNPESSARSSVVKPVFPFVRSALACLTQSPSAEGVRS